MDGAAPAFETAISELVQEIDAPRLRRNRRRTIMRNSRASFRIPFATDEAPPHLPKPKEFPMHKDQAEGAAKDMGGKVKEAAGKLTGNERLEAEGHMDQAAGKVQKGVGDLKEGARDALKK
ncbi:CsbD family protein [Phenylobacterium sp.]|uniref:CsbD family protein n=1 Tax=Phenylobacterium sp. TaxID=1871053 RepID=UPI0040370E8C